MAGCTGGSVCRGAGLDTRSKVHGIEPLRISPDARKRGAGRNGYSGAEGFEGGGAQEQRSGERYVEARHTRRSTVFSALLAGAAADRRHVYDHRSASDRDTRRRASTDGSFLDRGGRNFVRTG